MSTDTDRGGVVCMECGERFDTVAESIEHGHMSSTECGTCLERVCGWAPEHCQDSTCEEHAPSGITFQLHQRSL